jgi:cytochrome c553
MKNLSVIALLVTWTLLRPVDVGAGPLDHPGAQKSIVCSACHGFGGNSPGNHMPIIAGMNANYFKKTIKDYAEGKRPSPEMEPYSKYVLQFGADEIADFFASQQRRAPVAVKAEPKAVSQGASLAAQCAACHGPKGDGDPERSIPGLRGQNAGYLQVQSALFASDKRKLDDAGQEENKKRVFKGLGEKDLADLAVYYATLK